ncbi:hypothetical protein BVRB_9g205810 [Beta vulgaris subsp. vulgaris]|nr:hypothetical protein BVRB_9g205810 [Beta vulgaris subsp. vulgaris]
MFYFYGLELGRVKDFVNCDCFSFGWFSFKVLTDDLTKKEDFWMINNVEHWSLKEKQSFVFEFCLKRCY